MATQTDPNYVDLAPAQERRVSVSRLGFTGGVTAALVFVLCWLGTFVPFSSPTHAYISLFTALGVNTPEALIEGSLWSLLFGGFGAAIFAIVYNFFEGLESR
jgi:hypothetical protein